MPDLSTQYLGLSLGNPLIAGSSGLSASAEGVERLAEAGAGAVVLKSVFEEEIALEYQAIVRDALRAGGNPEALDYLDRQLRGERLDRYRALIAESKRRVDIPVIASVHCTYSHEWVTFAREMEAAGADALELNMFFLPTDWSRTADEQEQAYLRVIERVRDEVSIPVALKISHYFTSLGPMIQRLSQTGVAGLVLFNRLWQPDFDIERLQVVPSRALSTPAEITLPLRWVALTAGRAACDLAASTGVHDGEGAIKMLLAGARAVQVVSALYLHGVSHLRAMLIDLARWMDDHGYETIDEFRGLLSQAASANPAIYERVQYMRFFGPTLEGQAGDVPSHGLEGPPR